MTAPTATAWSRAQFLALAGAAALVPLNSTMIAVALPRIADDFDLSVGRTSLLVTVYLAVMLVGQPVAGRVSDRVGSDRAVRAALVTFLVSSVGGALAPTFPALVVARVGQATAGAMLVPSVQAMLRASTSADERGRVFGLLGSMLGVGAAAGPVVAGGLIQVFGWQAMFLVNAPVIVPALLVPLVRAGAAEGVGLATAGRTWRNLVFVIGFGVQALTTLGQYMLLLVSPVLLEARGWSSAAIGVALSGLTVGMIVMGPIGGRTGDRAGRRRPVVLGVGASFVALVLAAVAGDDITVALLVPVLVVFGLGLGFAIPSNMTAALESVEEPRTGAAAGVLAMSRYVGSITTSLLVGAWIAGDGSGAGGALTVAAVAGAVALLLAVRLPGAGPAR